MKRVSARRERRAAALAMHAGAEAPELFPLAREITNQWDVCDFVINCYKDCDQCPWHQEEYKCRMK
jgi:hypothetical protein